jgi:hypothetical protein
MFERRSKVLECCLELGAVSCEACMMHPTNRQRPCAASPPTAVKAVCNDDAPACPQSDASLRVNAIPAGVSREDNYALA